VADRNGILRKQAGVPARPTGTTDGSRMRRSPAIDGPMAESRVERGIQLVSRWAGIAVFVAALVGIGYLIF
jgi:hypothetical protein